MQTLNTLIYILRVFIIPSGVIVRVIYCLMKMIGSDEIPQYKGRIVTAIGFGIVAELILSITDIIEHYY